VRLGVVHRVGPAWDSMANGRIDRLIHLDLRLETREEGGPVLDGAGLLLGMSTLGPRRRVLVIPTSTVERVLPQLLAEGRVVRGWLGLGLQPVGIPSSLRMAAGRESGLMVVSLAAGGPAERAGVLPGDILLEVAGASAPHPRAVARALSGDQVGKPVPLRLLRAGAALDLQATVALRPAA
jgi:S1-C subfamily serine protease